MNRALDVYGSAPFKERKASAPGGLIPPAGDRDRAELFALRPGATPPPWPRNPPRPRLQAGFATSVMLHALVIVCVLTLSRVLTAPPLLEPMPVDIVAEAPAPPAPETAPPAPEPDPAPTAAAPPPVEASPPPTPPAPVAQAAPPIAEAAAPASPQTPPPPVAEISPPQSAPPEAVASEAVASVSAPPVAPPDASEPSASEPSASEFAPVFSVETAPRLNLSHIPLPVPRPHTPAPGLTLKPIAHANPKPAPATSPARSAEDAAPRPAPPKPGQRPRPLSAEAQAYQDQVYERIAACKRYPQAAVERGPNGAAVVRFSIDQDGEIVDAALMKSAGDEILDADAIATVQRAAPFPPPPHGAPHSFAASLNYKPR